MSLIFLSSFFTKSKRRKTNICSLFENFSNWTSQFKCHHKEQGWKNVSTISGTRSQRQILPASFARFYFMNTYVVRHISEHSSCTLFRLCSQPRYDVNQKYSSFRTDSYEYQDYPIHYFLRIYTIVDSLGKFAIDRSTNWHNIISVEYCKRITTITKNKTTNNTHSITALQSSARFTVNYSIYLSRFLIIISVIVDIYDFVKACGFFPSLLSCKWLKNPIKEI